MKWLREGISVLAALVAIFALWLGRSAVKLENGNTEACLHLNQDQVNYSPFLFLLVPKVTKLHLEGSQLVCGEDCHFVEPLNCIVKGWSQAGYEVSCSSRGAKYAGHWDTGSQGLFVCQALFVKR